MAVTDLPISRQTVRGQAQGTRGQIGEGFVGQEQETAVIGNEREAAAALFFGPADPLIAGAQAAGSSTKNQHAQPNTPSGDRIPELLADRTDIAQVMMFAQQTAGAGLVFARGQRLDLDGRQVDRAVALMGADSFGHGPKCETLRATCPAPRANSLLFRYLPRQRNFP